METSVTLVTVFAIYNFTSSVLFFFPSSFFLFFCVEKKEFLPSGLKMLCWIVCKSLSDCRWVFQGFAAVTPSPCCDLKASFKQQFCLPFTSFKNQQTSLVNHLFYLLFTFLLEACLCVMRVEKDGVSPTMILMTVSSKVCWSTTYLLWVKTTTAQSLKHSQKLGRFSVLTLIEDERSELRPAGANRQIRD